MRKRFLVLAAPFDYYRGGSEYQYKILEPHLARLFDVFYCFRHPTPPPEAHYVTYDYLLRKRYREYLFTDAHAIYRKLEQISPDVVYKRGINYITAIGIYYAKRRGRRSVLHIASQRDLDATLSGRSRNRLRETVHSRLARYSIRHADRIVCQSQEQRGLLESAFDRHCDLVMPNIHPTSRDCRHKSNTLQVVWVGNIKPLKRPELFLDLAEAFAHRRDVRFVMIGRAGVGRHFDAFRSRLKRADNVAYLGELPIDDVNRIVAESHVLVNTSEFEGFPNTFIQAWQREVPVVSLNVDPDALLANERLGFCSGTPKRLVCDVGLLLQDADLREDIGRRARTFADSTFGEGNADTFVNLLTEWTA